MSHLFPQAKQIVPRIPWLAESGQAVMEFSLVATMMIVLSFGVIDFSRAIYLRQVLINLSRETANLEARGNGTNTLDIMRNALDATITSAQPLLVNSVNGTIILTALTNFNSVYIISEQFSAGTLVRLSSSRVGSGVGNTASLPKTTGSILPANHTVYVAEIFYKFTAITPVGHFFSTGGLLPTNLYDVAYFSAL
jgi:Flp pilus assembly protein TadG